MFEWRVAVISGSVSFGLLGAVRTVLLPGRRNGRPMAWAAGRATESFFKRNGDRFACIR